MNGPKMLGKVKPVIMGLRALRVSPNVRVEGLPKEAVLVAVSVRGTRKHVMFKVNDYVVAEGAGDGFETTMNLPSPWPVLPTDDLVFSTEPGTDVFGFFYLVTKNDIAS